MANSVAIPQDIIDNIIEAASNDRPLLKTCALVSSSFLLPSRKHLFSKISLRNDQACKRLYRFLVENPVFQSFVRSIAIIGYKTIKCHALCAILRLPFCYLESLSIGNLWRPLNWNAFSKKLKDVLSTIIHSSTLKALYISGVQCVPITLFHDIHLTKLVLNSFWPNDSDGKQSSKLLTSAASKGATSHTVIDQCVWNFDTPRFGLSEPIFLPFMCRLRVFEIYINPSSSSMIDFHILSTLMRSLRFSLTSPTTLEHLKFDIVFEVYSNNFNYYAFFDDLRNADVWRHLDSIITHSTGSRLQRVDITTKYTFFTHINVPKPDNIQIMQPVLDALPLLREKGILFVEGFVDSQ